MFAVRFSMTHDKGNVFAMRLGLARGIGKEHGNGG
jgi:hypothetical protein